MRFLLLVIFSATSAVLAATDFTAELLAGKVNVTLSASPERIDLSRDFTVRITVDAPAGVAVSLPDLRDRFEGFSSAEDFASEPVEAGDRIRQVSTWRLVPAPGAPRYRLAPFAVSIDDSRSVPRLQDSRVSSPLVFPGPAEFPPVTGEPEADDTPLRIPPTAAEIAGWVLYATGAAAAAFALFFLLRKIRRTVKLMRMTPSQRALFELERLVQMDLPGKGMFKNFYVELTQVVRRYVERVSGIKAPTMTTEEFLSEVSKSGGVFGERKLEIGRFLRSADMIKFAGVEATCDMADSAVGDARGFIEPVNAGGKGGR